ncbi:MAG: hypothetical protein ACRYFX_23000 [Janthinobacterium lividum]
MKTTYILFLCVLSALVGCQSPPTINSTGLPSSAISTPAPSEAAAKAAVARYVIGLPTAHLYELDHARAVEVDTYWQVLVPRTDWVNRMPNCAAFNVDKSTGSVRVLAAK